MSNTNQADSLELFTAAHAAVEPYIAGGLIDHAVGGPVASMDGIVTAHLSHVALLSASGDTTRERPTYVLDPDTGILINYAYRRDDNPAKTGWFADVVQLSPSGRPIHEVTVVNPFKSNTGFIQVEIEPNEDGFAPSSVKLNLENGDPSLAPNIQTADLLSMLQQEPIPEGMSLQDFMVTQREKQVDREFVQKRKSHFYSSEQALNPKTNGDLHVIISDREDPTPLAVASRELGIFPIIMTARDVLGAVVQREGVKGVDWKTLRAFVSLRHEHDHDEVLKVLTDFDPAYVTLDFESFHGLNGQRTALKYYRPEGKNYTLEVFDTIRPRIESLFKGNPPFSRLENLRIPPDYEEGCSEEVMKEAHGKYRLGLDPTIPQNLESYTGWLRKARLDYMLTLYLRGLSEE